MRPYITHVSRRDINRFLVINSLRQKRLLSRVDLARQLGLTPAAITHITSELIEEGYIREHGPTVSSRGRRPVLLELNSSAAYAIGVDLQHLNRLGAAIVNLECESLYQVERPIPETTIAAITTEIRAAVEELLAATRVPRQAIFGVGVSFPGIVDYETGTVLRATSIGWENVPLRTQIQPALDLPVYLDNESNVAALGEYWFGQADIPQDFVFISVGRGIGSGLMMAGQLHRGIHGSAGEFGHMIMEPGGPVCRCGARGCLEALISEPAVLAWVKAQMQQGRTFQLEHPPRRPRELYEAANAGDALAREAVQLMGRYLGLAISNLINFFNPEAVVIGGNVWHVSQLLLQEVRQTVSAHAITTSARKTRIIPSSLGADTAIIGAATLVLEEMFQAPVFQIGSGARPVNVAPLS